MSGRFYAGRVLAAMLSGFAAAASAPFAPAADEAAALPGAAEMAASRDDVWGEAAIRQPGGPGFEFFRDLLPPLRYVNTEFRHYPIVLSAPLTRPKARWISNGGGVNLRATKKPMWREAGSPVHFFVGSAAEPFGDDLARLDGPRYPDGFLPIVECVYRQGGTRYEQQAFAPVDEQWAKFGLVMVRFRARGGPGEIAATIASDGDVTHVGQTILDAQGRAIMSVGPGWRWDGDKRRLSIDLPPEGAATLGIFTAPAPEAPLAATEEDYLAQRKACVRRWTELLHRGTNLQLPEAVVQNAWRALVVGNFMIAEGDRMHYSAGNAYDHLYESECGDAVRSLLAFGHEAEARRMLGPLLAFQRQATRFHVAGHKLQLLAHYYWITRDAGYLRASRDLWQPVAELIVSQRQANGLLPADNYAGDVKRQVISLSSNATCWRGLRDLAAVLRDAALHDAAPQDADERDLAVKFGAAAGDFRKAIWEAVSRSERREVDPPFVPIALLDDEPPHDPLTATRLGSYYNLMAPYVLGSGVFPPGSDRETWIIEYLRRHGGVALGMIRSTPHQGEFDNQPGANVLYGLRYLETLLRRDDVGRALAGFYGQLAQGMTRDTFIGGEGSRFLLGDRQGRPFYLPPNSAANATFLITLRRLLIQDWDLDDDGRPETLRLLYGIPGRWLADGAALAVERAPTAFGELSLRVESKLSQGEIRVDVDPPPRAVDRLLLRLPMPNGWRMTSIEQSGKTVSPASDGAIEISSSRAAQVRYRRAPVERP